jgi:hypothetical protein
MVASFSSRALLAAGSSNPVGDLNGAGRNKKTLRRALNHKSAVHSFAPKSLYQRLSAPAAKSETVFASISCTYDALGQGTGFRIRHGRDFHYAFHYPLQRERSAGNRGSQRSKCREAYRIPPWSLPPAEYGIKTRFAVQLNA